jgi:hypothetical protein
LLTFTVILIIVVGPFFGFLPGRAGLAPLGLPPLAGELPELASLAGVELAALGPEVEKGL